MLPDPVIDLPAARPAVAPAAPSSLAARTKTLAVLSVALVLCFGEPLYQLARFSMHSDLYSHILLMPFISGYLVWLQRRDLVRRCKPSPRWALVPLLLGLSIVGTYWMAVHFRWQLQSADFLALMPSAFLLLFLSGWLASLGGENLRAMAFPLAMLVFMIPLPEFLRDWVEAFLQHGSAEAAYLLFKISGMPVLRDGTHFQLP